jgi:hypothetical protein
VSPKAAGTTPPDAAGELPRERGTGTGCPVPIGYARSQRPIRRYTFGDGSATGLPFPPLAGSLPFPAWTDILAHRMVGGRFGEM